MGIFSKINFGLSKTRNKMNNAIDDMLDSFDGFEDDLYTELEEILVMGDVGIAATEELIEELKKKVKEKSIQKEKELIIIQMKKGNIERIKNPQEVENSTVKAVPVEVKK